MTMHMFVTFFMVYPIHPFFQKFDLSYALLLMAQNQNNPKAYEQNSMYHQQMLPSALKL